MTSLPEISVALLAGILSILSPCVFPLLPIVLAGALQRHHFAPLAMGGGMVLSFALVGLLVGIAGDALGLDTERIRAAGAVLLIALGITMLVPALSERFTEWVSPLASGANSAAARLDSASIGGAFVTGSLLGIVWCPCSGPMLASALTMVATQGDAIRGTLILGAFGLGAAGVLVAAAYASRTGFGKARGWVLANIDPLKKVFALLIMLVGLAILTGADRWLEAQMVRLLPESWIRLTTQY